MRLDINKIDDRIKKLQEIKRILSDPELTSLLMEFLTVEAEAAPAAAAPTLREPLQASPPAAETNEEADRIIKEMIQSSAADPAAPTNAFWTRGRGKG
jgi:hypothetical protein